MAGRRRHSGKRGLEKRRGRPSPFGRLLLVLLLVGLLWLFGRGVLYLWHMVSTGL